MCIASQVPPKISIWLGWGIANEKFLLMRFSNSFSLQTSKRKSQLSSMTNLWRTKNSSLKYVSNCKISIKNTIWCFPKFKNIWSPILFETFENYLKNLETKRFPFISFELGCSKNKSLPLTKLLMMWRSFCPQKCFKMLKKHDQC